LSYGTVACFIPPEIRKIRFAAKPGSELRARPVRHYGP